MVTAAVVHDGLDGLRDSMLALPWRLPMQDLGRTTKSWSVAISHVHWARQFKLCWSRQHHAAVTRERMIEVHRVHVKYMISCRNP